MHLSWSHPDKELPKLQQDNYLYILSCQSEGNNFELSVKGGGADLKNLLEHTRYTCHLSVAPLLSENETAVITFTTLGKNTLLYRGEICFIQVYLIADTLTINFINDTPSILSNTIRLEFLINRPVAKITCRIIGHDEKQDCKHIFVTYDGTIGSI